MASKNKLDGLLEKIQNGTLSAGSSVHSSFDDPTLGVNKFDATPVSRAPGLSDNQGFKNSGLSRDEFDSSVRKQYAASNPSRTGGEFGALTREVNSGAVYLTEAEKTLKNLYSAYEKDPSQENADRYNNEVSRVQAMLDKHNQTVERYNTEVENKLAELANRRTSQKVSRELDAVRSELQRLNQEQTMERLAASEIGGRFQTSTEDEKVVTEANRQRLQEQEKKLKNEYETLLAKEQQELIDSGEYREVKWDWKNLDEVDDALLDAFKRGYYGSAQGLETTKELMGDVSEKAKYDAELEKDNYKFIPRGKFLTAVLGAMEMFGQQAFQLTDPTTLALAGTGAFLGAKAGTMGGAAAGSIGGPLGTGIGGTIGATAGALIGLRAGMATGSARINMMIEAGHAYNEMVEAGVPADTAKAIAMGVGVVNAALEAIQFDELAKSFDALQATGSNRFSKALAKELAKRVLVDPGSETAQEVLQEGSTIAGVQLGSYLAGEEAAYSTTEILTRLKDTAASSYLTFLAMGLPGNVTALAQAGIGRVSEGGLDFKPVEKYTVDGDRTVSVAADPAVMAEAEQANATRAENPGADVKDAATTLYMKEQGLDVKVAQKRADVVADLIAGKKVEPRDINKLEPGNPTSKRIFSQLTGVVFPDRKLSTEELYNLYRSAHAVAVKAEQTAQAEEIVARAIVDEIKKMDAERGKTAAETKATAEDTVLFAGQELNREQFGEMIRTQATNGAAIDETTIDALFAQAKQDSSDGGDAFGKFMDNDFIQLDNGGRMTREQFKTMMRAEGRPISEPDMDAMFNALRDRGEPLPYHQDMAKYMKEETHEEGNNQQDRRAYKEDRGQHSVGSEQSDTRAEENAGESAGGSVEDVRPVKYKTKRRTFSKYGVTVKEIPPSERTPEMTAAVGEANAHGWKLYPISGNAKVKGVDKAYPGLAIPEAKVLLVSADFDFVSFEALYAHEKVHMLSADRPGTVDRVVDELVASSNLKDGVTEEEAYETLVDVVMQAYSDYAEEYSEQDSDVSVESRVLEEFVADLYAGVSRLGPSERFPAWAELVRRLVDEAGSEALSEGTETGRSESDRAVARFIAQEKQANIEDLLAIIEDTFPGEAQYNFSNWMGAKVFLDKSNDIPLSFDLAMPGEDVSVEYFDGESWNVVAEYPNTAAGLKQFNAGLADLVAQYAPKTEDQERDDYNPFFGIEDDSTSFSDENYEVEFVRARKRKELQEDREGFTATNSAAFKEWFHDDSGELTNEDGTPKVFLRGTPQAGATKMRQSGDAISRGLFFTDERDIAISYADDASIGKKVTALDFLKGGKENNRPNREWKPTTFKSWHNARQYIAENFMDTDRVSGLDLVGINSKTGAIVPFSRANKVVLRTNLLPVSDRTSGELVSKAGWREVKSYPANAEGLEQLNLELGDYVRELELGRRSYSKFYLSAEKTFVYDNKGDSHTSIPDYSLPEELRSGHEDGMQSINGLAERAFKAGYDCVVVHNVKDVGGVQTQYIVKDPEQVKSVYNTGTWDKKNPDFRYMVAGPRAQRAPKASLRAAKALNGLGVKRALGWWKGADGKWRFEVDDSGMEIRPTYKEADTLAGVIRHPELFKQYPKLRRLKVEFADWSLNHRGRYDSGSGILTLNKNLDVETLAGTILHEVQHWIQETEERAVGSNKYTAEFIMFSDAFDRLKEDDRLWEIEDYKDRVRFIEQQIASEAGVTLDRAYFDGYKNAIGEREARDTQERQKLTKDERLATVPFLADTGLAYTREELDNVAKRYLDAHEALGYDVSGTESPYSSASWWSTSVEAGSGVMTSGENVVGRQMDETLPGNRVEDRRDGASARTEVGADQRRERKLQSSTAFSTGSDSALRRLTEQPTQASEESGASSLLNEARKNETLSQYLSQLEEDIRKNRDLSKAQIRRRVHRAENKALRMEESAKAEEFKRIMDEGNNLTAWVIYHTKKLREQKRTANAKIDEIRREHTKAIQAAIAETKMVERAKAEVQHDADRMAERRNAAKRLRVKESTYKQKIGEMKENLKLKRNAAKATLRNKNLAEKRRSEIETAQGLVDTIRKNPKQRTAVERLQDAAAKLRVLGRSAYRNFVNMAEAIDRFSKRQASGMRAGTLVTVLGGSASTVDNIFKKGLVDRAGNRIADSFSDVMLCWDSAHKRVDEAMQALLQDFMLHRHNVDRMSFVSRARANLEAYEADNSWLAEMDSKELARLAAMTEKEAEKLGKTEAHNKAVEYAILLRAYNEAQDKPIFADANGEAVTAETSQKLVEQYLAENPWLEEKAQSIYDWWDLFMRTWAVGDTISEAEYERMRKTYPHYVPTYRADKNGVGGPNFVGMGGASVSKAVKRAKGGFSEVLNIEDSFSNIISKIVRLERTNALYKNIIDTAMLDEDGTFSDMVAFDWDWQEGAYGRALQEDAWLNGELTEKVEDTEAAGLEKVGQDYKLTAWIDGRKYSAYISEDLYASIGNVTGHLANDLEKNLLKVGNALTGPMKTAITGINPNFAIRNLSRDLPTAIVNSISGVAFPKYYAQAAKEIAQNSERWQTFQALGGTHATYYNDNKGFVGAMSARKGVVAKATDVLGSFNEITEAQTRFAEYLATVDRLGDTSENRLQGIKNAAEVTVDFSRKGRYGKVINAWVPYWNPAVQGIDKVVRSLIESPDGSAIWKQASKTLGRAAMTTVLVEAVQYAILKYTDNDDEWEELNDRTKDAYYCIPVKSSKKFLKIPKNREWGAILGTPFMRMLEYANGRENPFENYIETAIEPNFLPPAIFRPDSGGGFATDVIGFSWMNDLAKNEDFAGRTIVPYAYQQGSLDQQFDSETSWYAKQLGKLLNFSPMQIDYIINDYFGDFGELFQTLTAEATWSGDRDPAETIADIFTGSWFADPRYSNQKVNDYYETMSKLETVVQDKKNQLGNEEYKKTIEYQTNKAVTDLYGDQITELNKLVRGLPDGEEKDAAKAQIAQLASEALDYYEQSMSGAIKSPILDAEYKAFSGDVSAELIRLDGLSADYSFKPTGRPSSKYTDPKNKNYEYVLDDEQKDYFKQLYQEQYDEIFGNVINSSKYRKASDTKKAELLEAARDDVLDETKEEFFDWLRRTGVRSTKKAK